MDIKLAGIHHTYGDREVLRDINLDIESGQIVCIVGPSGCGKSTLLRLLGGLERPTSGDILQVGNTPEGCLNPLTYVFQDFALLPWRTVAGNISLVLEDHGIGQAESQEIINDVLARCKLSDFADVFPKQISGGMKQRVAIARALLINPRLLLMDEPLASLDANRKQEILPYLEILRSELALPIVYVTHSADEVARLADYLVAIENGKVVASGSLAETFNTLNFPISLGEDAGAIVEAVVAERDVTWHLAKVTFPGGSLWFRDNEHPVGDVIRVRILARDISLSLMHADNTSIINALPASVAEIVSDEHPALALVKLRIGDRFSGESVLIARVTRRSVYNLKLTEGSNVWAQIKSVAIIK